MNFQKNLAAALFLLCSISAYSFDYLPPGMDGKDSYTNRSGQLIHVNKNNNSMELNWGNDAFTPQSTDRHLTNTINIKFETSAIPFWLDDAYKGYNKKISIGLSQYMYSPDEIESEELVKNDRPYAGWLFSRAELRARKDNRVDVVGFEAGVVGHHSYADVTQYGIHEVLDVTRPRGWAYQVGDEVGVNAFYERLYSFRKDHGSIAYEAIPHVEVKAGNVSTYAEAGGTIRAGYNMPDDMGVGLSKDGSNSVKPIGIYVFTDVKAKAVLRDMFLDGNTFHDSIHTMEKENYVATVSAGLVVQIYNVKIGYVFSQTSKEFKKQDGQDVNGTVMIVYSKRF